MIYLNKIVEKLTKNKVIIKGVDKNKINSLEQSLSKKLPLCYKEFLEKFGETTDAINVKEGYYNYTGFQGESIFYDNIYGNHTNKDGLMEQLQEDGKTSLISQVNDNVFVFFSSQGYIFAFFKLDEGENPPVYGYVEGQEKNSFPKLTNSLLEFFELYLEDGKSPFNNLK
ncbi:MULTISPECIES: SMI1/KNR4 family protein [Chryseobacterium]|uniref:SMI1 / KNR4 family n=1 Tax=Chryseobacterium taihuense TaxID=1141221 RepID=A0A4U8WMB7_9FLAO|nr:MULTISPECIES: SMI1/KNR4 family protein [Chryseobacterium]QQV02738.1 SMI1/KNR4 family protein [Chryseobacterium sp. FDAARGOS 1104]VFB03998.1 SMI1 / KNR4 family [Chryseobacterium taihuense]